MALQFAIPTPLDYFGALVRSDGDFALFEAAVSLALNRLQTFTYVVLPPALKKIWPSLVSQVVIVMLGSSVCGQISTKELSYAADLIQSNNFRSFEAFMVVGAVYLLLSFVVRHVLNWLGATFVFGRR